MMVDQPDTSLPAKPLLDAAWSILEAANDLRDIATVEACRRIIDEIFRGRAPAQSDINIIQEFFN
jgi:hypothetical protein